MFRWNNKNYRLYKLGGVQMNNTMQLYIDEKQEIKGYPITSPDTVIDENGVSIKEQLDTKASEIDLEIDGKQHKYKDRIVHDKIRDEYIKSKNIIVYRIEWNEIKSENGSNLMKEKIGKFLEFYNKLPLIQLVR